jgi:hypothetical protein
MFYESKRIRHWWIASATKGNVALDCIFISYVNVNLMSYFSFKRTHICYFDDDTEEYVTVSVPDVRYISLLHRLNKYAKTGFIRKKAA